MAKSIRKTKVSKPKKNIEQEVADSGTLFQNSSAIEKEIPMEITNLENINKSDNIIQLDEKIDVSTNLKNKFSLSNKILIEVHKSNVLQYFSSGCIYPSKYSNQKAFPDPQTINENGLLISNGLISNNKDHILIQVDDSAIDSTFLTLSDDFGLYSGMIPISRIIKIFVQDIEVKKKILDDSIIRDAGIIPESIIEVGFPLNLLKISYNELCIDTISLESKLKQYDKILGLISGTRNFNLLTYNQTEKYKSISDHSLFAVQAINENFARKIVDGGSLSEYYKWLFTNSCPNDRPLLSWIFNRVYENDNFTDNDTLQFEKLCYETNSFLGEEKQLSNIFASLKKSIERKKIFTNITALNSKNSLALYVFAYLRNYGTRQNPELPRLELVNSQITKFSEYAFATINFFFGYQQLRNTEDRINILDETITQVFNISAKPNIKFELTTEFDYMIIDMVFNYVFSIKNNNLKKYQNIVVENLSTESNTDGYEYFSSLIFGKIYSKITKVNILDQLLPLINNLPNEITIFSEFGLFCHRAGLKRTLISLDELIGNPKSILKFVYYSKKDLIDIISRNKVDLEEVKQRIALSQKYKEL